MRRDKLRLRYCIVCKKRGDAIGWSNLTEITKNDVIKQIIDRFKLNLGNFLIFLLI